MDVVFMGMESMPRGRRDGMGPYVPSSLPRYLRWVRGVPTCTVREHGSQEGESWTSCEPKHGFWQG